MEEINYNDPKIPPANLDKELQTIMKDIIVTKDF